MNKRASSEREASDPSGVASGLRSRAARPSKRTRCIGTTKNGACRLAGVVVVLFTFLLAACFEQTTESSEERDLLARAAEMAEEPESADSIQVLDDERSVARRVQDATIATQVRIALVEANDLRPFDFDPVVVNGRVLLQGEVRTQEQRRRAEAVASGISGVREVVNEVSSLEEPEIAEERALRDTGSADAATPETTGTEQPAGEAAPEEGAPEEEETYHTVRSGESLWRISRRYGVSVDQLQRLNNLSSSSIKPGQRLRVK